MRKALLAAAFATLLATPILAHEGQIHEGCDAGAIVTSGDLTITGAFTRAMLPQAPSAGGYFTITNGGTAPDRLTGASSEAARVIQLHEMTMAGDVMKMGELPDGIEIPAGSVVALSPGGLHLMMFGIKTPFKEGECLQVTLQFETTGDVPVVFAVAWPAADGPPEHNH